MRELGVLVYHAVAGAMALIAARQITKREIGAELTMIVATRNNPLKFLPTAEAAVMQLLGPRMPGFMAPVDSMADAFEDLRAHEVGVIAGTRAAFAEVLRRFDPKELEQRLGRADPRRPHPGHAASEIVGAFRRALRRGLSRRAGRFRFALWPRVHPGLRSRSAARARRAAPISLRCRSRRLPSPASARGRTRTTPWATPSSSPAAAR